MEKLMKGDVVVMPFPFSDLSSSKRRPALVVANLEGEDIILCQITSVSRRDKYSLVMQNQDFLSGSLNQQSMIRPNRLFTAERSIINYKVGSIKQEKKKEVESKIVEIFKSN